MNGTSPRKTSFLTYEIVGIVFDCTECTTDIKKSSLLHGLFRYVAAISTYPSFEEVNSSR